MTDSAMPPFEEWARHPSASRLGDPLWTVQAYRLSSYALECHSHDAREAPALARASTFDQLTRSIGSIAANIAEGYSRPTSADRAKFYGYALGSTREAIVWYDSVRRELGDVVTQRQAILVQVRRLLLTTLRRSRNRDGTSSLRD